MKKHTFITLISIIVFGDLSSIEIRGPIYSNGPIEIRSPEEVAELRISILDEHQIEFEMNVTAGSAYYFGYTESLSNSEWKTAGMTLSIEATDILEGYFDPLAADQFRSVDDPPVGSIRYTGDTLFRFFPTEETITGIVTFSGTRPSKAFFRCFKIEFSTEKNINQSELWTK